MIILLIQLKMFIVVLFLIKMISKKGQVWVETVVYTLIAFAMIGLVLSFVRPQIEENKDRAVIEQSINVLEKIDYKINEIKNVPGNKRTLGISIERGKLTIDGKKDRIFFELVESNHKYSDEGKCTEKDFVYCTFEKGKYYEVNITKDYENYNLTFDGKEEIKEIHSSPTKYTLFMSSEKRVSSEMTVIDFSLR